MSLFSWFAGRKPARAAPPDSSGLSRMDSTKPCPGRIAQGEHARAGDPHGRPANRKSERIARRELLYGVVRECMAKAGVVSASYKFKVLSLDPRGREFLVMVDVARDCGSETANLAEIEAAIAQSAKGRFDIVVTAVYWRMHEHVALGINAARPGTTSRPAPLAPAPAPRTDPNLPPVSQPTPLEAVAPLSRQGGRFEPIEADEVDAFRKALATGTSGAVARSFEGAVVHGPQSYTLLTGFEDTELCGNGAPASQPGALSATQYGELR